ncbi:MAG: hypothetical protein NTV00_08015 [Methylococcales bacterium]|nr:hypothetical protein [Methylococcales bacterium]
MMILNSAIQKIFVLLSLIVLISTANAAPVLVWSPDIAGASVAARTTVNAQPTTTGWSTALPVATFIKSDLNLPVGTVSQALPAAINSIGTSVGQTHVSASLRNMSAAGGLKGVLDSAAAIAYTYSASDTLQASAPKPSSLYGGSPQYLVWNETTGGDNATKNAVLFEFDNGGSPKGTAGFGAWFGDLETISGTPAVVRLFDVLGNQMGADITISNTTEAGCGGVANGCGNNSTRWIGFTDSNAAVAAMLVIVGDNTAGQNGNNQHISFIGPKCVF